MEEQSNLEMQVIAAIRGAVKPREAWEAAYPDLGPLDDDRVMLENWASTVNAHGMVLAHLAMFPQTRAELKAEMPGMVDRAPAWLEAQLQGCETMTLELFFHGIAQTLASQRAGIERVASEQASDPAAIEETLAKAPVPAGTEERGVLLPGVSKAMMAHVKALVDLAYDLEVKARWHSN